MMRGDECTDRRLQLCDAAMGAAAQLFVRKSGEPPLAEVQPGHRGLVRAAVVHDPMHVEVARHGGIDWIQELPKRRRPMSLMKWGDQLAGLHVGRGERGACHAAGNRCVRRSLWPGRTGTSSARREPELRLGTLPPPAAVWVFAGGHQGNSAILPLGRLGHRAANRRAFSLRPGSVLLVAACSDGFRRKRPQAPLGPEFPRGIRINGRAQPRRAQRGNGWSRGWRGGNMGVGWSVLSGRDLIVVLAARVQAQGALRRRRGGAR
jgi:hypothetical protein